MTADDSEVLIGSHLCGGECDDPCTDPDPVRPA